MTPEQIKKYKKAGWTFRESSWEHPHNGVGYTSYMFSSPRLDGEQSLYLSFDAATEDQLLDHEANLYASQLWLSKRDEIGEAFIRAEAKRVRLAPPT